MLEIDGSEFWRNPQVDNILEIRQRVGLEVSSHDGDGTHTIGSCGTGLGPIFTLSSAAVPAAFIVHAVLLLLIQVMYCSEKKVSHQPMLKRGEKVRTPLSSANPSLYSKPYTA